MGAAEMVLATGKHPAALKDDVTTPAGCTIASTLALEDGHIRSVLAPNSGAGLVSGEVNAVFLRQRPKQGLTRVA